MWSSRVFFGQAIRALSERRLGAVPAFDLAVTTFGLEILRVEDLAFVRFTFDGLPADLDFATLAFVDLLFEDLAMTLLRFGFAAFFLVTVRISFAFLPVGSYGKMAIPDEPRPVE